MLGSMMKSGDLVAEASSRIFNEISKELEQSEDEMFIEEFEQSLKIMDNKEANEEFYRHLD